MIKKLYRDFSGLLIICALFFAWCCMTVSYNNGLFLVLSTMAAACSLVVFLSISDRIYEESPLFYIILALVLVNITYGACRSSFSKKETAKTVFVEIFGHRADRAELTLSLISLCYLIAVLVLIIRKRAYYKELLFAIKNGIIKYKWLILLLLITAILSWDADWKQYKWDSLLYCQASSILDMPLYSEMGVYGHLSQGFSALVKLFEYTCGDILTGLFLGNVGLLLVSSCYVYALLKYIIPEKNEMVYLAGTAVYAFSPYYLGMVNYYSLDYYLMCILPIVVYYAYSKKWMQMTIASVLFCFTKETAILIYGLFCVGVVMADIIAWKRLNGNRGLKWLIISIFSTVHYYYMAMAGILWIATYKMLGPWVGGSHSVGINLEYILSKLKVLYIMSFNWIFTLLAIIGLVVCICRKKLDKGDLSIVIPLLMAQLGFTVFNLVFVTANHPRYTDATPFVLYILALYVVYKNADSKKAGYGFVIMAAALLLQCFITIDPVSMLLFDTYNTGSAKLITAADTFGDSAVYNKQMLWAERPLCNAIDDAVSEDSCIVLTAFRGTTNISDGMATVPTVTYTTGRESQEWDNVAKRRAPFKMDNTSEIEICHITENGHVAELAQPGSEISIIYSDIDDRADIERLLSEISVSSTQEYSYRGWIFHRIAGTVN